MFLTADDKKSRCSFVRALSFFGALLFGASLLASVTVLAEALEDVEKVHLLKRAVEAMRWGISARQTHLVSAMSCECVPLEQPLKR